MIVFSCSRLLVAVDVLAGSLSYLVSGLAARECFRLTFLMNDRGLFMNKYVFPGTDASYSLG